MAKTHMIIQNVILMKRYVRHLLFVGDVMTVEYVGGNKIPYKLETAPSAEEIATYELELEDRPE